MIPYLTEVLLVHLDLFDIRGVVGCVDLVLFLMVLFTIETLRKARNPHVSLFHPTNVKLKMKISTNHSVSSYIIDDLVSFPRVDKVDTLWMKSVGLCLHHLIGLLVLHLHR